MRHNFFIMFSNSSKPEFKSKFRMQYFDKEVCTAEEYSCSMSEPASPNCLHSFLWAVRNLTEHTYGNNEPSGNLHRLSTEFCNFSTAFVGFR